MKDERLDPLSAPSTGTRKCALEVRVVCWTVARDTRLHRPTPTHISWDERACCNQHLWPRGHTEPHNPSGVAGLSGLETAVFWLGERGKVEEGPGVGAASA